MTEPTIADTTPSVLELEPGTYYWCRCGRSTNQPWCDGSHAGTDFEPMPVEIQEKKKYALCRCKHTVNSPFCDGSHKRLPTESA